VRFQFRGTPRSLVSDARSQNLGIKAAGLRKENSLLGAQNSILTMASETYSAYILCEEPWGTARDGHIIDFDIRKMSLDYVGMSLEAQLQRLCRLQRLRGFPGITASMAYVTGWIFRSLRSHEVLYCRRSSDANV